MKVLPSGADDFLLRKQLTPKAGVVVPSHFDSLDLDLDLELEV